MPPSPLQLPPRPPSSSSSLGSPEAAEDLSVPPEAYEVPALYTYFAMKRMNNFPLRLSALRQASTIVLSNMHHQKYVCVAGRVLLGGVTLWSDEEADACAKTKSRPKAEQYLFVLQILQVFRQFHMQLME
ncbi:hypothetical protein MHYP_G00236790 [Metynnis hypsauchen]